MKCSRLQAEIVRRLKRLSTSELRHLVVLTGRSPATFYNLLRPDSERKMRWRVLEDIARVVGIKFSVDEPLDEAFRCLRELEGSEVYALANRLGISHAHIYQLRAGKVMDPSASMAGPILDHFGISWE